MEQTNVLVCHAGNVNICFGKHGLVIVNDVIFQVKMWVKISTCVAINRNEWDSVSSSCNKNQSAAVVVIVIK